MRFVASENEHDANIGTSGEKGEKSDASACTYVCFESSPFFS